MRIVDPTQNRPELGRTGPGAEARPRLDGRVCLLSNSKPNASALLEATAARLGLVKSTLMSKPVASKAAPDDLLSSIATSFESALVAIGD